MRVDGCPARRSLFVGLRCCLLRARTLLLVQPYGTIYLPAKKFHRGGRARWRISLPPPMMRLDRSHALDEA